MPTPVLILIALLALVVEIVFMPPGEKPLWQTIAFVVGFNVVIVAIWFSAHARFTDGMAFVQGLDKSTLKGLRGLAVSGVLCGLIGVLSGYLVWPFFDGAERTMDWSALNRMFPTFVFLDTATLLFKRWRSKRNVASGAH